MEKKPMELLRMDRRGRVRMSREQRVALLEEYGGSGLSAAEFARHYGVKYQTFTGWLQRRKGEGPAEGGGGVVPLVEVALPTAVRRSGAPTPVVVELGGGARVELRAGGQVGLVAELVRALAAGGGAC
jgi:transposase-like protein